VRLFLFIFTLLFISQSIAEENSIEYKIKAGYLYNFTKFITWPEDDIETFNLCILGKDPFGSILNPIENRTVKNKSIRVYRIRSAKKTKHCHIIYGASPKQLKRLDSKSLTISSLPPKLTVGETRKLSRYGSMIAFFLKDGKVKLRINLDHLRKSGLDISAKLLEIAEVFEGESND